MRSFLLSVLLLTACQQPTLGPPLEQALCTYCTSGVCTDLQTDPANCGACGNACPVGYACYSGACECGHEREACCPAAGGSLYCAGCLDCCPLSQQNPPYGYCQISCGTQ